jgi:hypothetical protein
MPPGRSFRRVLAPGTPGQVTRALDERVFACRTRAVARKHIRSRFPPSPSTGARPAVSSGCDLLASAQRSTTGRSWLQSPATALVRPPPLLAPPGHRLAEAGSQSSRLQRQVKALRREVSRLRARGHYSLNHWEFFAASGRGNHLARPAISPAPAGHSPRPRLARSAVRRPVATPVLRAGARPAETTARSLGRPPSWGLDGASLGVRPH